MKQRYTPSDEMLAKYAELIIKFGLQRPDGSPLPKDSVVECKVPEVAKPLYTHIQAAILRAGHHPFLRFIPSPSTEHKLERDFYEQASQRQREEVHLPIETAIVEHIDATIVVVAETDIHQLDSISGKHVMERNAALKVVKELKFKKIDAGKLSWTIAMYGTDHMAQEAGMSLKALWQQIIEACYLDHDNPVKEWKRISRTVQKTAAKLTDLKIQSLHWQGEDMDITVGVGDDRKWQAAGGNNIPSYEVFTSPNMNEAEGWIRFNQPHFKYGKRIEGIELWFKNGKVTKAKASKNEQLLKSMVTTKGGNRLGEISLTDKRISRITKPTGEIMYDENMGGKFGNTHMAIGSSFHDCYQGNGKEFTEQQWERLGFNNSVVHSDFISTTDRTVTATLQDGSEKVIYQNGQFIV